MKEKWLHIFVWGVVIYGFYIALKTASLKSGTVLASAGGRPQDVGPFPLNVTPAGDNLSTVTPRTAVDEYVGSTYLGAGARSFGGDAAGFGI